ncbi:MAG: hypothetical protein AAF360_15280 [Pseudomonadota bacterium]
MQFCGSLTTCIATYAPVVFDTAFSLIAAASAVAAVTPTPNDDRWIGKVYRLIDLIALNVGYAKDRTKSAGGRFVPE